MSSARRTTVPLFLLCGLFLHNVNVRLFEKERCQLTSPLFAREALAQRTLLLDGAQHPRMTFARQWIEVAQHDTGYEDRRGEQPHQQAEGVDGRLRLRGAA